jgi:CHAD domain-containing protein
MAYCFKRKESVSKAVRRMGRERIEHALECLKECDRAEAIHCARKDIKKVRAVVRMVRSRIAKNDFRRLTGMLRDAAAYLAASRDACIKAQTLRDLAEHFKGQLAPGALRHVRAELRRRRDEEMKRFAKEKTARAVERLLHRVAKLLERLKVSGKEWKALGPGVEVTYREGRRAYQTVLEDSSPENFHEWRKRAKDLWYQVRLLQPVWREQMEAMASELETLGESLGEDHDLVVLKYDLEERSIGNGNAQEMETLNGLIEQRQRDLRAAALALGARFYSEKPSVFCNRLAGYWRTWRREKKPLAWSTAATP